MYKIGRLYYRNVMFTNGKCGRQVGRSLGASILDLTGQHPHSRIPSSEHRNLAALRDWLRAHTRAMRPQVPHTHEHTHTHVRTRTS